MGLADILRGGIAIADSATKDVQPVLMWEAWIGQTYEGDPSYATAVPIRGIADMTRRQRYNSDGQLVTTIAALTILEPVTPNGAAGRREPIDTRDRITLPDGATGPLIQGPGSVWDPGMSRPFLNDWLVGEPSA